MALRFFVVPVNDSGDFEQDLNGFLASHKVVSIDRRLIDQGTNSFWAICVDYLRHAQGEANRNPNLSRNRIDYKTVLPPEEFKEAAHTCANWQDLAQIEAVPVYALFTNEQLAKWFNDAAIPGTTWRMEGIGDSKIDKYAERLLPLLLALEARPDAPSGEPV